MLLPWILIFSLLAICTEHYRMNPVPKVWIQSKPQHVTSKSSNQGLQKIQEQEKSYSHLVFPGEIQLQESEKMEDVQLGFTNKNSHKSNTDPGQFIHRTIGSFKKRKTRNTASLSEPFKSQESFAKLTDGMTQGNF